MGVANGGETEDDVLETEGTVKTLVGVTDTIGGAIDVVLELEASVKMLKSGVGDSGLVSDVVADDLGTVKVLVRTMLLNDGMVIGGDELDIRATEEIIVDDVKLGCTIGDVADGFATVNTLVASMELR